MHIYDFITDQEQYKLKNLAIKGKGRFENILDEYKNIFFRELQICLQNDTIPKHLQQSLKKNESINNWLDCFSEIISQEIGVLEIMFQEIIDGYKLFLKGKHYLSTLYYQNLLEKYDVLIDENLDKLGLFYRGFRKSRNRDSKDIMQYFHIPYGMRQLVANQRFSFSGIPLIYLGSSIADVYYEMGETDLNSNKLTIASFSFNPISSITVYQDMNLVKTKTKIFNITNEIYNLINKIFEPLINGGMNIPDCTDLSHSPNSTHLIIYFRKFIISQLCTFPKRYNSDKFHEEYVIPQLFTEALYMHKYDGIIFPSTKFNAQDINLIDPSYNLGYKENLVMFTKYSDDNDYDQMLLKNFNINIKSLRGQRSDLKQRLITQIDTDSKNISLLLYQKINDNKNRRIQGGAIVAASRIDQYQNLLFNNIPYLDTKAGKLELVYTRDYFSYLRSRIPYLNNV